MSRLTLIKTALAACVLGFAALAAAKTVEFNVPGGALKAALDSYVKQAGVQLVYKEADIKDVRTRGVNGALSVEEALTRILAGTQLMAHRDSSGAIAIVAGGSRAQGSIASSLNLAQADQAMQKVEGQKNEEQSSSEEKSSANPDKDAADPDSKGIPEMLVKGTRSLNADMKRTEDDVRPYVVFDREQIENSMAGNLEVFLKTRLPMNQVQTSNSQQTGNSQFGNQSAINLRGLGTNQTLVLVNGRRMPSISRIVSNDVSQPDINGIPLSAVERIEVLPSSASAIYGGGATGGVVNIILRRAYSGMEMRAVYDNAFDTDTAQRRFDASAGFNLEGGKTQVLLFASYSDSNPLLAGERNFAARSRALMLVHNPAAFYGELTPPVGFTTNFIGLNPATFEPENLVLKNGTSLGSAITTVPVGYRGITLDGIGPLVAKAGTFNLDLPQTVDYARGSLINNPVVKSSAVNIWREFGSRVEVFANASIFENTGSFTAAGVPSVGFMFPTDPANPFNQVVGYSFPAVGIERSSISQSQTLGVGAGMRLRLPRQWNLQIEYDWRRSRSGYERDYPTVYRNRFEAAVLDGSFDIFRDLNAVPPDYSPYLLTNTPTSISGPNDTILRDGTLRLAGPALNLPAGPLTVSMLLERRKEALEDAYQESVNENTGSRTFFFYPRRSQSVDSAYVELTAPLVPTSNERAGLYSLELQSSVRYDGYKTRVPAALQSIPLSSRSASVPMTQYSTSAVDSTDISFGAGYSPLRELKLRMSYGTGFLAPTMSQITPGRLDTNLLLGVTDPLRLGDRRRINTLSGGNPELEPERSRSWSAGLIWTPRALAQLRLSLDYTRIRKEGEIAALSPQTILDNESLFPGRVVRAPLENPAPPSYLAGPILSIDYTTVNVAVAEVEAYDLQADYTLQTNNLGNFSFQLLGSLQTTFYRQLTPTAVGLDSLGYNNGPVKWRGNGGITWNKGAWTAGWNAQYYHSYYGYNANSSLAIQNGLRDRFVSWNGTDKVPSQMFHDLFVRYRYEGGPAFVPRFLKGIEAGVGIQDAFNTGPVVLADTGGLGSYSGFGDVRLRRYTLSLTCRL